MPALIVAMIVILVMTISHDARGESDVATGCLKNGQIRDLEFGDAPGNGECREGQQNIKVPVVSEHINVGLTKSETTDLEEALVPLAELGPFEIFGLCSSPIVLDPPFGIVVRPRKETLHPERL